MPSHWTYSDFADEDDLEQGDFVAPSDELRTVLDEVHPHFTDAKYLGFLILSQTCDLVRRQGKPPSAGYVAIAPVRLLRAVVPKLFRSVAREVAPGLFKLSAKDAARQLLERIVDQNEQKLGLFYLHQDADLEIGEPSVCFLRVSVSLRSEHYDVLRRARRGRLKPEFGNKLGWLAGNLYSRTATPDWTEQAGIEVAKGLINDYISAKDGPDLWVDDSVVEAAVKSKALTPKMNREEALEALQGFAPQRPLEDAVNAVVRVAKGMFAQASQQPEPAVFEKLRNKLLNDGEFRKQLRKSPGA